MHDVLKEDSLREECGVFGVWGSPEAAHLTLYGLYALQHRGQEAAGMAVVQGDNLHYIRGQGLVSEVFGQDIDTLSGHGSIGHVRYSTTGGNTPQNTQPLVVSYRHGQLALAHNGNIVNARALRRKLEDEGSVFQSSLDTEVIAHLIAHHPQDGLVKSIRASLGEVQGAYALVFLTPRQLVGVRDAYGIRPLVLGKLDGAHILASETCALDAIGADFEREVKPGEMVVIDDEGVQAIQVLEPRPMHLCVFEHIYFARPDSQFNGGNVHAVRKELGRVLARTYPVEADLVTGVPDSSISAAAGYAEQAGLPFEMGLVKNRYIGRTFIQPSQSQRDFAIKVKLNPLKRLIEGKRVVLVDDSIVRGTTSRRIVRLLRDAGATEVHVRISSPPYRHACHYGIDTSAPGELIAAQRDTEGIRALIEADSLAYLTVEDLFQSMGSSAYCTACFDGNYPVDVSAATGKRGLEVE